MTPSDLTKITAITYIVCSRLGVTMDELEGKSRRFDLVFARWCVWSMVRDGTTCTFHDIARIFDKTHGAIMHGVESLQNAIETDRQLAKKWKQVSEPKI